MSDRRVVISLRWYSEIDFISIVGVQSCGKSFGELIDMQQQWRYMYMHVHVHTCTFQRLLYWAVSASSYF